jgi:hypothetical protein
MFNGAGWRRLRQAPAAEAQRVRPHRLHWGLSVESVGDRLRAQEARRWRSHRRIAGGLNALLGVSAVMVASMLAARAHGLLLDAALIGATGVLQFLVGIGFALGSRWPRVPLWPLSVIHLIVLPVGTIIGGYTIWVLYHTRAVAQPSRDAAA